MKFRRKNTPEDPPAEATSDESGTAAPSPAGGQDARAQGPWDSSEVDLEAEKAARVDLGGLLVKGRPGLELRLQVDEKTQQVAAVMLVNQEGALELRPFAAPRNGGIWPDIRKQIAAETARRGGTATEAEGAFGTELRVAMPAKTPDGKPATQPSRVLGVEGPRWLLRATFIGRPAVDLEHAAEWEEALTSVVVRRGTHALPVGEALPIVIPPEARPA